MEIEKYRKNIDAFIKHCTNAVRYKSIKTPIQAFNAKVDSLVKIKTELGEKSILTILKIYIVDLNEFLNLARKMQPEQINQTAQLILDEFYYLKISDLSFIFKRIKTGFYGSFYESLDGLKLMEIFYRYAQERADLIEKLSIDESDRMKYQEGKSELFRNNINKYENK